MQGMKEVGNILRKRRRRRVIWIGHILNRNCLLQRVVERKIERRIYVTGRRGRRRNQLLIGLEEKRGCWKFEALDCCLCRTRFGRGYEPVVRRTSECMTATYNGVRTYVSCAKTIWLCIIIFPIYCENNTKNKYAVCGHRAEIS
jgi:hypothetical protein